MHFVLMMHEKSGRLQARILQTEIGYLIFWVFFVESDILHQTALSLVNSNTRTTCCLRIQSSKRCLYEYMYIDSASIILYQISMLKKWKYNVYIKLDIHLQFRLLIWGRTLFNILLKLLTSIFTAAVITMITYRTCSLVKTSVGEHSLSNIHDRFNYSRI